MKLKLITSTLAAVFLSASAAFATTLADWTFETSQPARTAAAGWFTNIVPEMGTGTASALHASSSTVYSSPSGNGTPHSFSSTFWAAQDFYQFAVSTLGAQNINVTFDAISSSTGPRDFSFAYSTDGINFTQVGTYANANSPGWSTSGTPQAAYTHTYNLSSITALNNAAIVYFRVTVIDATSSSGGTIATGGTSRVDNFIVSASTGTPPTIGSVTPSSATANAGSAVSFTVTNTAGDVPFTYYWYEETATATNLITAATVTTNATADTFTLPSVLLADAANYQVVVSNATAINATSAPVTLTVIDPAINSQPVSQVGLPNGEVQFQVSAGGTGLNYQWYYCASASDNTQIGPAVGNGTQASGSIISGATSSVLTITNLQAADPTNFVVVVTGAYGSVASSVASLTEATSQVPLAFWNFNGPFNVNNPAPYQGIGTASCTNVTPFVQPTLDANDPMSPSTAWGTDDYPAQGNSNKQAGVQFNVSTVGAKNITVAYDIRGSGTASKYHRLQFTTDGTTWIDYPASSSVIASGTSASTYLTFNYSLAGFPGVANNPNFGVRMVTEFQSTATYGDTNNANYQAVGTTASYGTAGSVSYDLVTISADAITNNNAAPTIGTLTNMTMEDTYGNTENFTVSDDTTPAGSLTVAAASFDPNVSLSITPNNANGVCQLAINSSLNNSFTNFVPVVVTVTDADGDSSVSWFTLTIVPGNAPPAITGLPASTNLLTSSALVLPFTLADDHTPVGSLATTVTSGNSALVPNDGVAAAFGGSGANRTLIITPVAGQSGAVPITVSSSDGDKSSSQTIVLEVRPSTNIVLVDNFTYDNGGAIDLLSGGLWANYSGHLNEMLVGSGAVTIDGVNHTEDVEAGLIGAPYPTNSATVLYSKFYLNYSTLPGTAGSYFAYFTDGSTSNFVCRVWAFTNGAAAGDYRVGIATSTNTSASATAFPQDLTPGTSYLVVSRLVLSTMKATVWVNPVSEASPNVTATDLNYSALTRVSDYDFRESTADEGIFTVSNLVVATTFNDAASITPADVSLTVTGPTNVFAGANATYTVIVSNAGPISASNVQATDTLSAGVAFVSATGGGVNNGGTISWALGTLASGTSAALTVTVTAPLSGAFTNSANASSDTPDSALENNSSLLVTKVAPLPLGAISFSAAQPAINWSVQPGVSYSILWSTNLSGPYTAIASGLNFTGTAGSFTDTQHASLPAGFYKITSP